MLYYSKWHNCRRISYGWNKQNHYCNKSRNIHRDKRIYSLVVKCNYIISFIDYLINFFFSSQCIKSCYYSQLINHNLSIPDLYIPTSFLHFSCTTLTLHFPDVFSYHFRDGLELILINVLMGILIYVLLGEFGGSCKIVMIII